jgi:chemotaxis protein CheD
MKKEIVVPVGKYIVSTNPTSLICLGLGSCLAITLYDKIARIGGLAHAMLPSFIEGIDKKNPGKYVDTSIYLMVDDILEIGGDKDDIEAKLIGGSQMFSFISPDTLDIGSKNIQSAKTTLKNEGIPIVSKDVGGQIGRTISFNVCTGKVELKLKETKTRFI